MTWRIAYSYLTAEGDTFDTDEFIYDVSSASEALRHFEGIADAYKFRYGWKAVFVWGVKLMYKFGRDIVKEVE